MELKSLPLFEAPIIILPGYGPESGVLQKLVPLKYRNLPQELLD